MKAYMIPLCTALLLALSTAGHTDIGYWSYHFSTGSNQGGASAGIGTDPASSDTYDAPSDQYDIRADRLVDAGYGTYFAAYHSTAVDGSAWTGPSGFYWVDRRAPLSPVSGQTKTWTMYLWGVPGSTAGSSTLSWSHTSLPDALQFTLTLVSKPAGVSGGPATGTVWDMSTGASLDLPIFRTADGREGYVFDFTATVIPEPSSLLAILTGLAGLGAVLWRRRS